VTAPGDTRGVDAAPVRFGVLGARSMVATRAVMPALSRSTRCDLIAVAAAGGPVPVEWAGLDVGSYDAVVEHPDVEVVYVPLPNGLHEHWAGRAAAAGKHVLCEKPLAPDAATAKRMEATCRSAGVMLAEAWMTPFDARWSAAVALARGGRLGDIQSIDAVFTFRIGPDHHHNYRWDPLQGGGALLDVGIYCLGAAVELWGPEPTIVEASTTMSAGGVDATTRCQMEWHGGGTASIVCSFVDDEAQRLTIAGSTATAVLDGDAYTGGVRAIRIDMIDALGHPLDTIDVAPGDPYLGMVDAFADAVRGIEPWPRPVARSIEMLTLVDRIAAEPRRLPAALPPHPPAALPPHPPAALPPHPPAALPPHPPARPETAT
jgi:predicted dehydrogenase